MRIRYRLGLALTTILTACNLERGTGPARPIEPLPADPVPALSPSGSNTSLSMQDLAFATASDPDVQALANTTQLVRWYYIMDPGSRRWYIVNPTSGSALMLDGVDETTSFGIYWKPINRYEAASGAGSQRYQSAFDNYASITLAPDGRSIRFGSIIGNTTDSDITALAGSVQPVRWFYVYSPGNTRWYIASPVGRQVLMLHHVERRTSFGIHWKPISNVTANSSASTSSFTDAGDNYPGLTIASDGSSISFNTNGPTNPVGQSGGSIHITISGLDAAAQAGIVVTGPNGYHSVVHTTSVLSGLAAGTYTIAAAEVSSLIRYQASQPSQQQQVGNGSATAITIAYSPVRLTRLSGFASLDNSTRTAVFLERHGSNDVIETGQRTWVVVHGRLDGPADVDAIATAVHNHIGDQILVLSWQEAARATSPGGLTSGAERWIVPVGQWAARVLEAYGFVGDQINLIGHSWGAYVVDELAEELGGADVIVALDPGWNTFGSNYNPNDPGTVHFGGHSKYSLAFNASWFGNESTPTTADEAFAVEFNQPATALNRHAWIKDLFVALLNGGGIVSRMFELQRLLDHLGGPWKHNQYQSDDANTPTLFGAREYEGILSGATTGPTPARLRYRDRNGDEQTLIEATIQAPANTLRLDVSPTGITTIEPGDFARFDIHVTDGNGNLIRDAIVSGTDPFTRQQIVLTTAANGQIMRNILIPQGTSSGSYSITFTATKAGYGSSAAVTRQMLVQSSTNTASNIIMNGGFEQGAVGWSFSGAAFTTTTLANSRSGSGYAFMGTNSSGVPVDNTAGVVHQAVSIPSSMSSATLRFWVSISTGENPNGGAYDFMSVMIVSSSGVVLRNLAQLSNLDAGGYRQLSADLSEYRGQSIRIVFSMSSDQSLPTVFRLDDFSLGSP